MPVTPLNKSSLSIKKGDVFDLREIILTQKFTEPPSRYSEAGLIKKLEEIGLGRPSTYASIISTLYDRGYLENSKGSMKPSTLGMQVAKLLGENFDRYTSQELTSQMEKDLDEIADGKMTYLDTLNQFWWDFNKEVDDTTITLKQNSTNYRSIESDVECPTCSSKTELKLGRFGEYYQCLVEQKHQFPKNFREYAVALLENTAKYENQTEGKKCTECDKDMIVRVAKSSLKPYIACPEYRVGNKHTITNIVDPENKILTQKSPRTFGKKTTKTTKKS